MKKRRPPGPKSISNRSALGSSLGSPFGSPPASPECLTPRWRARYGIGAAALLLGACVDDVDPNTGIMSGAGSAGMSSTVVASAGSAGATPERNTAGSGGGGAGATVDTSDPAFGSGARCPAITQALLTDFTYAGGAVADAGAVGGTDAGAAAAPNPTGVSFGDFTNTLSGSSYVYPNEGAYLVSSDVTGNNWHMTGSIGTYSGFGIVFVGCSVVDASAYRGISFTVQGSVPMGPLTFSVGTAANDVTHLWLNTVAMPPPMPFPAPVNAGRCIPAASQYDGSCAAPSRSVPVSAERTTVNVLWADLIAGRPAATVDPKEITNMAWAFPPPPGAGTTTPTTYPVDLTIDDLQFIAP